MYGNLPRAKKSSWFEAITKERKARVPKTPAKRKEDCLKKKKKWNDATWRCEATVENCDPDTHKVVQLAKGGQKCMTKAAAAKYEAKKAVSLAKQEAREAARATKAAKKAVEKARKAEKKSR